MKQKHRRDKIADLEDELMGATPTECGKILKRLSKLTFDERE